MTCRKFFLKKLVKSNLCAVFRGIARNLSWQRRKNFLGTQRNRTALFRKKRQTLYRRLWFQEFFIFFRLFLIGKIEKIIFIRKFVKFFEKIFCFHFPFHRFLQCRAARSVTVALPFRYTQPKTGATINQKLGRSAASMTFPRIYAIAFATSWRGNDFPANICDHIRSQISTDLIYQSMNKPCKINKKSINYKNH